MSESLLEQFKEKLASNTGFIGLFMKTSCDYIFPNLMTLLNRINYTFENIQKNKQYCGISQIKSISKDISASRCL